MSDAAWQALWSNLPATIAALAAFVTSIAGVVISIRNARKVEEIHKSTNSMKDALVEAAAREGHAAGVREEQERAK